MILRGGRRLQHWRETLEEMFLLYFNNIPRLDAMSIIKFHDSGGVTSYTCNSARKTRRLLVQSIEEAANQLSIKKIRILEIDCWNLFRDVWLGGITKTLSVYLKDRLMSDLECIDQRLRVVPNIEMILRAVTKEFSLCDNYPKGHGEIFH